MSLPGDVSMTVLVPNASEAERARLPGGGAPVRLSWEPEHMHVVRESQIRPRRRRGDRARRNETWKTTNWHERPRRRKRQCVTHGKDGWCRAGKRAGTEAPGGRCAGARGEPRDRRLRRRRGGIEESGGGSAQVETVKVSGKPSGDLTISNWPLYIDKQTVPDFEKATGVQVKYIEDVNDNQEFFGKLQPLLAKGESGGRSIFVVTDWMAKKMYDLGYLQNLDKSAIPNVEKNLVPIAQGPALRPERRTTRCRGRAG